MKLSKWMRQAHRILSIAFTAAALVNIVAMLRQDSAVWIGLLALVPLILLLVSGLYLFALPYMRKENRISSELQDAGAR